MQFSVIRIPSSKTAIKVNRISAKFGSVTLIANRNINKIILL